MSDCLLRAVKKGIPQRYCSASNGQCTAVREPQNGMKCRKALLSEEVIISDLS